MVDWIRVPESSEIMDSLASDRVIELFCAMRVGRSRAFACLWQHHRQAFEVQQGLGRRVQLQCHETF